VLPQIARNVGQLRSAQPPKIERNVTCAAGKEPGKHVVLLWSTDVLLLLQQHLC
jgi:hypothetical protein